MSLETGNEYWRSNVSYFTVKALLTTPERRDDLIAVSIWLVLILYSIFCNILLLIGLMRNKTMRRTTSYWFIISLAVCDLWMSCVCLFNFVPAVAFQILYVNVNSFTNYFVFFVYDVGWYSAVSHFMVMAANRCVSIVFPSHYSTIFSKTLCLFYIFLCYCCGVVVSLPTLFPCCQIIWDYRFYIATYMNHDSWYSYVDVSVSTIVLLVMILSYAGIIMKVRKSKVNLMSNPSSSQSVPLSSQISRREFRLFIQFFLISLIFVVTWTTWQWLPRISASKWAYFIMTSFYYLHNALNPTIYLIFNSQLRQELGKMIKKTSRKENSTGFSTGNTEARIKNFCCT